MRQQIFSHCKSDQMSVCMANSHLEQQNCSFYEESQHASRCMYFVFDEYCDCLEAQMKAQKTEQLNKDR
ncbi:MAG: hypothetical protein PVG70_16215 [Desulfobacterales bacterium]|jgi:hypothetical protein